MKLNCQRLSLNYFRCLFHLIGLPLSFSVDSGGDLSRLLTENRLEFSLSDFDGLVKFSLPAELLLMKSNFWFLYIKSFLSLIEVEGTFEYKL